MTYLIENETAALLVPARFAAQVHPHFREVMQLLAIQAADEARHIEVFTRRALLRRTRSASPPPAARLAQDPGRRARLRARLVLAVGARRGQLSVAAVVPARSRARPGHARGRRLAAQDEARHVAFGLAHLERHAAEDPTLRERLAAAVERRHARSRTPRGSTPKSSTR